MTLFHAITFGSTPLQSKGTKYGIPLLHDIVDYLMVGQCVFPYTHVHACVRVCICVCNNTHLSENSSVVSEYCRSCSRHIRRETSGCYDSHQYKTQTREDSVSATIHSVVSYILRTLCLSHRQGLPTFLESHLGTKQHNTLADTHEQQTGQSHSSFK